MAMTDVDRHVQGCGACASWQDRAARINRLTVLSPASEERDLVDEVLGRAAALSPAGGPELAGGQELAGGGRGPASPSPRRISVPSAVVRVGLLFAALAQAAVAVVELLGQDDPMMMAGHMEHETSAFNFALGVVLAIVAVDPRRARAQLPLLGSVVGVLVLVSTFDLGAHAVGWSRLVTHIPLAAGLILVALLGTNSHSGTTGTATARRTWRFPMRTAKRLGVLGSIVLGGLLAVTGSAYAHVTAQPSTATQGSYSKIAFRVPNEEDNASTVKLEVTFPADHPIASVETKSVPGWTAQVEKSKRATPLKSDDGPITEAVSKITWTGGKIGPDTFEEFEVSLGPLPTDTDKLVFKAVQTYDNGDVVRWIDTSGAGGPEAEHPAPTVQLTPKSAAAAVVPTAATSSTSDSTLPLVFGIVGIVIGLGAGALAMVALRRGRATE
ncbi:uncharacterized protein YcnI/predicted anti-sigma-YlaC factor YlaD [Kutzneria kofuensis]|uniref:Uncharacterized protein YcnI/predicted anti-sigma-YlaC factor YlaD n=1 Tax=Kutzneria kofuensis TaxID=103725 RepID=A0A7W9KN83_9PSEU|nr:uncharacterized protein YcnI/predicted anti-sigma-YlaC factor YlaD [Kutzneria kofuensis]